MVPARWRLPTAERSWHVDVPRVEAVNAVGSGDSFNAGLLAGARWRALPIDTALRRGVAAGSANALALGAGMLDAAVARRLEPGITVTMTRR